MRARLLPWLGVGVAALLLLATSGMLFVAIGAKGDASDALANSERLYEARLDVARAEAALGGGDLGDANEAASSANQTALRVGEVTERIVRQLSKLRSSVDRITLVAKEGSQSAVFARRQTDVAADLLGSIRGYQTAAARLARVTNEALARVLAALERTNRNFPGDGLP